MKKKRSLKHKGVKLWLPRDGWDCAGLGNCFKTLTLDVVGDIMSQVVDSRESQRRGKKAKVVNERCFGYGYFEVSQAPNQRNKRWRGMSQAPA